MYLLLRNKWRWLILITVITCLIISGEYHSDIRCIMPNLQSCICGAINNKTGCSWHGGLWREQRRRRRLIKHRQMRTRSSAIIICHLTASPRPRNYACGSWTLITTRCPSVVQDAEVRSLVAADTVFFPLRLRRFLNSVGRSRNRLSLSLL